MTPEDALSHVCGVPPPSPIVSVGRTGDDCPRPMRALATGGHPLVLFPVGDILSRPFGVDEQNIIRSL